MNNKNNIFENDLAQNAANFQTQTPLSFLAWSSAVYPDKTAVIYNGESLTYSELDARCRRLASALKNFGVGFGDTVAVMAPNIPPMLEAHFGVPMIGAVLNALNYRLDSKSIAFMLEHGEASVLIVDREYSPTIKKVLEELKREIYVIDIDDRHAGGGELLGEIDYEGFLEQGDPTFQWETPNNDWQAISLNYTSGTTGDSKGVVYHHRGAFLNALGQIVVMGLNRQTIYLWTLPMFHCNGWCFPWAVTAVGGTHVCIRNIDPKQIFAIIGDCGVTHMCGAPIILNMLVHAPSEVKKFFPQTVEVATGGAAPPSAVIEGMENLGFHVTHLYGLTESYGPSTFCAWQAPWDGFDADKRAMEMARQGVRYPTLFAQTIMNPETMTEVPADGKTMGELMLRGNTVMKGYLKNPKATESAFLGGWFHTGDLGVLHSDGYVEIKDRSKDIIISGGENISSLEIEEVLYKNPHVMEAAVVAKPHEKWGETPCAFVTLIESAGDIKEVDIIDWCRSNLAHFKVPTEIIFGPLPKTSTGKIQKFILREQARDTMRAG